MKNIGQASQLTGFSQRMIRYFEEQKLLQPRRSGGGARLFSEADISLILKIKRLHELGFTYPEVRELLEADEQSLAERGTELLRAHHAAALDLEEKIRSLELLCFGEKKRCGPFRTLEFPSRVAYRIRGLEKVSKEFRTLEEDGCTFWKFGEYLAEMTEPPQEFSVYEILDQSSFVAVLAGPQLADEYFSAWRRATGVDLGAQAAGVFGLSDLTQFFGKNEIVIEHVFVDARKALGFRALLSYPSIFAKLGRG